MVGNTARSMDRNSIENIKNNSQQLLSSVFAAAQIEESSDAYLQVIKLLNSKPMQTVLQAASALAEKEKISQEEALKQIVHTFNELNNLWNQVLCKEGLKRLQSMM